MPVTSSGVLVRSVISYVPDVFGVNSQRTLTGADAVSVPSVRTLSVPESVSKRSDAPSPSMSGAYLLSMSMREKMFRCAVESSAPAASSALRRAIKA